MVKNSFSQRLQQFHTWGGLFFGWILFVVFFTGTLSVFAPEISYWMRPEAKIATITHQQALSAAQKALMQNAPDADQWFVVLPQGRTKSLEVSWQKNGQKFEQYVDPQTGEFIKVRKTDGGEFFAEFHYNLHHEPLGTWIVSIAGIMMLVALFSGIAIRKRVIRDFFYFRWRKNWLSMHTMLGVLTIPFVILITYSGLSMTFMEIMPVSLSTFYKNEGFFWQDFLHSVERPRTKEPAAMQPLTEFLPLAEQELGSGQLSFVQVKQPNTKGAVVYFMRRVDDRMMAITDRASFDAVTGEWLTTKNTWNGQATIVRSLVGLHIAKFGGYPMAWLYFILGLLSCVMIASGLVFFTIKRRLLYEKTGASGNGFFKTAEKMNAAVISGCIVASVSYFLWNRLLPSMMLGRDSGEIFLFFLTWILMLVHAFYRPAKQAWMEQFFLAGMLSLLTVVLGFGENSTSIFSAFYEMDWMRGGVDFSLLLGGSVLLATAFYLKQKWQIFSRSS